MLILTVPGLRNIIFEEKGFFGKLQEQFTPETLKTTTEQGVSEGIANGGKKLADSVKTAAGEVAGEIEQGGAKAAAKIKSESGCINLCKDRSTAAEAGSSAVTPEETPKSVEVIQETKAPVPVDTTTEKTLSTTASFLWTTFTRLDPAADLYSRSFLVKRNRLIHKGPIVLDARMKPWYPEVVECDQKTSDLVTKRWFEYFPDKKIKMGSSSNAHLFS